MSSQGQDLLGVQGDNNRTFIIFRLSLLRLPAPAGADLSFFSSITCSAWKNNRNSGRGKKGMLTRGTKMEVDHFI